MILISFDIYPSGVWYIYVMLHNYPVDPHVSNFDWTGCLAGCEERWGPGGREVDGRRVTLWDPSVVLVQTQQEACGRWKSILIQHSVLNMQSGSRSRK
jgi:hypothetical protein